MRILIFLLLYSVCYNSYSQNNNRPYYFVDYQAPNEASFEHQKVKIIGASGIDPYDKGFVNYKLLERNLIKMFPEKGTKGILCIDLENSIYKNIRNNEKSNLVVSKSIKEFVGMIDFIKNKRPNIKVGIYAIPFPFYYSSQKKRNEVGKLDEILSKVDIIFPSLYIYYPAVQKGLQSNLKFLEENLEEASIYAKKYNKEIIPLVWYLIHPSNKKYRAAMIDKSEMKEYMDYIWKFSDSKFKLKGVLIWNSSTPFKNKTIQTNLLHSKNKTVNSAAAAIDYYKSIW